MQKSNEGSYRCTVSNYAGSETSECATLTVGELTAVYLAEKQEGLAMAIFVLDGAWADLLPS